MGRVFVGFFVILVVGCLAIQGMKYINTEIYYKQRAKYPNAVVVDKYVSGGYRITDYTIVLDLDGDLSTADKRGFSVSASAYNNTQIDN